MGVERAFAVSVASVALVLPFHGPLQAMDEDPEVIIEQKCIADWPHNARMRAACIEQQEKVLNKSILKSVDPRLGVEDHSLIREKCAGEWPDDFRKRAQCEDQQLRGFQKLQAPPPKDVTLRDYSVAMAECVKEWPDDFRLRARCVEEQFAMRRTGRQMDVFEAR